MSVNRIFNFSAGPAILPLPVLEEAQRDLVALPGVGMSVLEISHRSKTFEAILEKTEQDIRALAEAGLRANWSYGSYRGVPAGEIRNLASVERLHQNWTKYSNDGLIALGYSWGGLPIGNPAPALAIENAKKEIEAARRLGLRISMHLGHRRDYRYRRVEFRFKYLSKSFLRIFHCSANKYSLRK